MMIEPLRKRISCSPLATRIPLVTNCAAIPGRRTNVCIDRNVFVVVRLWCDVHTARNPGNSRHNPITRFPTVKVFPTWRGMLADTPPMLAA